MNWEDLRVFLEVARAGSLRRAGFRLGLNHSTASRRIAALEDELATRLFDRTPSGLVLTPVGEEVRDRAERASQEFDALQRTLSGQDTRQEGRVCLTLPDHLLPVVVPELAAFRSEYPGIELDLAVSYESFSLARREADVALRLVLGSPLPEGLVGRKVARYRTATYASHRYLEAHDLAAVPPTARWIGWGELNGTPAAAPDWVLETALPHLPVADQMGNVMAQMDAVRAGLGIAMVPCFLADPDPELVRIVPGEPARGADLWLLTHRDLQSVARVRALLDFLYGAFDRNRALLEGRTPTEVWEVPGPRESVR